MGSEVQKFWEFITQLFEEKIKVQMIFS